MAIKIVSWNDRSNSALELSRAMAQPRIISDPNRSRYRWRAGDIIVNWGRSRMPAHLLGAESANALVNRTTSVAIAQNKHSTFYAFASGDSGIPVPDFTADVDIAAEWLNEGHKVLARSLLNASQGRGITVVSPGMPLPSAPLYVKYVPKLDEYRAHVVGNDVLVYQKRRRFAVPDERVNWQIRNFENGFAYSSTTTGGDTALIARVNDLGRRAVAALNLDFGAVDIIYNRSLDALYVIEVNTAPGLSDGTARWYAGNLSRHISQMG